MLDGEATGTNPAEQKYPRTHLLGIPGESRNKIWDEVIDEKLTGALVDKAGASVSRTWAVKAPWTNALIINKATSTEIRGRLIETYKEKGHNLVTFYERVVRTMKLEEAPANGYALADQSNSKALKSDGQLLFTVFKIDEEGNIRRSEDYTWYYRGGGEGTLHYLHPSTIDRYERIADGHTERWFTRPEFPDREGPHRHLFEALVVVAGGGLLGQNREKTKANLEEIGWSQIINPYRGHYC